mmetsp:Transcript_38133/g.105019  ORF Transcript_38133/g.105019 Transcript_38133/m.105019 type:complete len:333 (-) Transcript_38133:222-1220(-)
MDALALEHVRIDRPLAEKAAERMLESAASSRMRSVSSQKPLLMFQRRTHVSHTMRMQGLSGAKPTDLHITEDCSQISRMQSPVCTSHTVAATLCSPGIAMEQPSGEKSAWPTSAMTGPPWKIRSQLPDSTSHTVTSQFAHVVRIRRPSGQNLAMGTLSLCEKTRTHEPVCNDHNMAVPSSEPVKTRLPSGEKELDSTGPSCPSKVITQELSLTFHIFTVSSSPPVTTRWPSGENPTELTAPSCPLKVATQLQFSVCHTRVSPELCSSPVFVIASNRLSCPQTTNTVASMSMPASMSVIPYGKIRPAKYSVIKTSRSTQSLTAWYTLSMGLVE